MTIKIPKFDPVEYLVSRRYPLLRSLLAGQVPLDGDLRVQSAEADEYRQQLLALPKEELDALAEEERERAKAEYEAAQPYNQPEAEADFDYWSKAPYWSLEEAVVLSFGKEPRFVTTATFAKYPGNQGLPGKFREVLELARRAEQLKQLFDPALPGFFIAWARRMEIDFPEELSTLVEKRGGVVADWKSEFDTVKAQRDELLDLLRDANQTLEDRSKAADDVAETMSRLRARVTELEAQQASAAPTQTSATRSRDSLLKLVIGMAIAGYKYKPAETRNDATKEIAEDLQALGVGLDVDTVRKWLKAAAEMLPTSKNT